jgi:cobalamin biosynthesis protein CobD/CbiB
MLKNVDWGGLTIINLLGVLAFPPYFIYLMSLAALTASGFLWTTHLSEADQGRFIDFEKEFRKGYKMEKAGQLKEARVFYEKLKKRYANHPQANHLVSLQIEKLTAKPGGAFKKLPAKKSSSAQTKRHRS